MASNGFRRGVFACSLFLGCSGAGTPEEATRTESPLGKSCGLLAPNETLAPGQGVRSCDGRFWLVLQADGNLVLYAGGAALWASNTGGEPTQRAVMQTDGNLVLYAASGALWSSGTGGHAGAYLAMQNDGNVVVYDGAGKPLWASDTGGAGGGGAPSNGLSAISTNVETPNPCPANFVNRGGIGGLFLCAQSATASSPTVIADVLLTPERASASAPAVTSSPSPSRTNSRTARKPSASNRSRWLRRWPAVT